MVSDHPETKAEIPPQRPAATRVPSRGSEARDGFTFATGNFAPLRWLFVAAPLLLIAVIGSNLLGLWQTAGQEAARIARAESEERLRRAAPPAPVPQAQPDPSGDVPLETQIEEALRRYMPDLFGSAEKRTEGTGDEAADASPLPAPSPRRAEDAEGAAPGFDLFETMSLIATADVGEGARTFKMCAACHEAARDGGSKIGPNLWGVIGREKAGRPEYRYSAALKAKSGTWTYEQLALFLNNPRGFAPGTTMLFRGIGETQRMASLIAYLRTLSDAPPPLPQ